MTSCGRLPTPWNPFPRGRVGHAAEASIQTDRWRPGELNWTVVVNLSAYGLRSVTRLAVSPKGDRIAIVAEVR